MKNTLKVTNALSDPTRFNIYQYIIKKHDSVSVAEIAQAFEIHPNVARLHLSRLEDVKLLMSHTKKTGKGGRPGRLYRLADEVVELNFPYRDYKLLSSIAMETFMNLGEPGKQALYETGKKYGVELMNQYQKNTNLDTMSNEEKFQMLEEAATLFGMYPEFQIDDDTSKISMTISNCPFKEVALMPDNKTTICTMHQAFLKGMFEVMFTNVELIEIDNMLDGCNSCSYAIHL
ncbi:helix-turn-helix transcriptional regulator [Lentibacillus saliphilus]|uniref:helix-turn-helix transcriptional regulator n=1 Tax=Lentibacillus saliphilus TaxID=2737028 RepID=UPI001C2FC4CB|nr:helix-turn-helix domain-containing protein [Lentibacillus saliphilus]